MLLHSKTYYVAFDPICRHLKDIFGILPISISAPCHTIDDPHVNPIGVPLVTKDDAIACMAASLNTPMDVPYLKHTGLKHKLKRQLSFYDNICNVFCKTTGYNYQLALKPCIFILFCPFLEVTSFD